MKTNRNQVITGLKIRVNDNEELPLEQLRTKSAYKEQKGDYGT